MRISFTARFAGGFLLMCLLAAAQTGTAVSGIDLKAIDTSVDPCQNFYQYACGNWIKNNPVPPDQTRWGRFDELKERNQLALRAILEEAAQHQERSAIDQKIGAFYASCMDEAAIEKAGDTPIVPGLKEIAALKDKQELAAEVARLHQQAIFVFFAFGSEPDFDKSSMNGADVDQSGLGLPDKSYYLNAKDEETRQKYVAHISRMFQLVGDAPAEADRKAHAVMQLETALAKASLDRVARMDPQTVHHKMSLAQFEAMVPEFNFKAYFADVQAPAFDSLNVSAPDYFKSLNTTLAGTSLADLKDYLSWQYISSNARYLSSPFVEANFDFFSRYLAGAQQLQPRWKRCVDLTDRSLPDALGQKYVARAFAGNSKERTQQLVAQIEKEMEVDIKSLTWMSDATKQQALLKLRGVTNKIGYPEKWLDYSTVSVRKGDLIGDVRRAREFDVRRDLKKIGEPVDRAEFHMSPPTVNAYYSPLENNINFPAGILQPPFYNNSADMAMNFGAIGGVIGHELTHGFDTLGRQFDADGNLRDWWTEQDAAEFKKRADCLVNEYSKFSPVEGEHLNGQLTLGENGADNAGIRLAYMALLGGLENGTVDNGKIDGYTPEQRFFLAYAQVSCSNQRPEALRQSVRTNPHSPGEFRVIGVVENVPEFATAFGCTAGQPMVTANGCRVW